MASDAAVLLDWDGVLVDSARLYFELFRGICERYHKVFPLRTLDEFREWYEPEWEKAFAALGFTPQEFHQVVTAYPEQLDYAQASLFEAVPSMLAGLSGQWPLAIVSTAPTELIHRRLAQDGLDHHLSLIVGSDDGTSEKRRRVARTLRSLGVGGGVMVGDTWLDVEAGRANGLATVGVTYGWSPASRVSRARPSQLVHHPSDLERAIRCCLTAPGGRHRCS